MSTSVHDTSATRPESVTAPSIRGRVFPQPAREVPALAKRALIIGLDGATFDVLNPLMAAGRMPNLARLIETGASGVLYSTTPPITPAAWTTFMTGKGPGRHGIVDFEKYDVRTNRLSFNSTQQIREKTIWEMLSEKGFRVGSVNVPMTYPPRKVNGFMISGFETPSTDAEFTWPPEMKQEILSRWPDYSYRSDWKRRKFMGEDTMPRNFAHIESSFRQGYELSTHFGDKFGWDVLMVLYKLVDNLQHKAWKFLDPRSSGRYPREAEMAARCFASLDKTLGELFAYARRHEALIVIMSDHGHGSLDGKAQPNLLLEKWGYLKLESRWTRAKLRAQRELDRLRGRTTKRFDANIGIEHELAVDWPRTRACVVHAGMCGFLYLNLKDRQPGGIVDPGDYEAIRDDLIRRFGTVMCTTPAGEVIQAFPAVHKPEELYQCSREEHGWMPDLLLEPAPGLAVIRKIRYAKPVKWMPSHRLEGTHRVEGILAVHGPHVKAGQKLDGQIADITPTLLAALGLKVPLDMEGRVLSELFDKKPVVEYEPPQAVEHAEEDEVYTEEQKEVLTRRLSDLGYLE